MIGEQLEKILVSRDDRRVEPRRVRLPRERRDEIVRLDPRLDDHLYPERFGRLEDDGKLLHHLVGHFRTMGLVGGILPVALGLLAAVENDGEVARLVFPDEKEQHAEKTEHGSRILPLRIDERIPDEGEVGPVRERVPVHDEEIPGRVHIRFPARRGNAPR